MASCRLVLPKAGCPYCILEALEPEKTLPGKIDVKVHEQHLVFDGPLPLIAPETAHWTPLNHNFIIQPVATISEILFDLADRQTAVLRRDWDPWPLWVFGVWIVFQG